MKKLLAILLCLAIAALVWAGALVQYGGTGYYPASSQSSATPTYPWTESVLQWYWQDGDDDVLDYSYHADQNSPGNTGVVVNLSMTAATNGLGYNTDNPGEAYAYVYEPIDDTITDLTNGFTVQLWLNNDNHSVQEALCFLGNATSSFVRIQQDGGGNASFALYDNSNKANYKSVTRSIFYNSVGWWQLTCTYDGSLTTNGMELYINGWESGNTWAQNGAVVAAQVDRMVFGISEPFTSINYTGQLGRVTVYDGALSLAECQTNYVMEGVTNTGTVPEYYTNRVDEFFDGGDYGRRVRACVMFNGAVSSGTTWRDRFNVVSGSAATILNNDDYPSNGSGCWELNGVNEYVSSTDAAWHDFGDGSSDDPFTLIYWVNMDNCTNARGILKHKNANVIQYYLGTVGDGDLVMGCFDNDTSNYVALRGPDMTEYEGEWIMLAGTYDGTGTTNSFALYTNGIAIPKSDTEGLAVGSYTAMHNEACDMTFGATDNPGLYMDGRLRCCMVINTNMAAADLLTFYNATKGAVDL